LWNVDEWFVGGYLLVFLGYYIIGDGGYIDFDGYLYVFGCIDDVINVVGYWLFIGVIVTGQLYLFV
jgi:acyl-coenzyme A synthetase/AMP-(fatty) acid ligase